MILLIRNHQLAREPALRNHALARLVALALGLSGLVALLVMAWIPGDQAIHFFAALATFALLSIYASLHTGLCVALRRAPSARPWPGVVLLALMVACPAASIVFVVLWITEQSATPQYAAVAMQFAYFLALVPAFAKRAPVSAERDTAEESGSKYGPSVVAVLSALLFAVLVLPQTFLEMDSSVSCDVKWCLEGSPDLADCNRRLLEKNYVVARKIGNNTAYCPQVRRVESLAGAPHALASFATPFLWVLGTLGFAVVFFERPRRSQDSKRRALARAGLLLVALSIPRLSFMLATHARVWSSSHGFPWPAVPALTLAAMGLLVAYLRGDQLLRGKPIRGHAGPLVLAYAAVAAGIALGFAAIFQVNRVAVASVQGLDVNTSREFLAAQSRDALEPVELGLLLATLPLFLIGALSAFGEPRSNVVLEPRRRWLPVGVLAVAMFGHLIGAVKDVNVIGFLGLVPIAILTVALLRHRLIGRTTKLALVSGLVVADLAGIVMRSHSALKWAEPRALVDFVAIVVAFVMVRGKPDQESDDTRGFVAALAVAAATVIYAGCLWHAQDAQVAALIEAFSAP